MGNHSHSLTMYRSKSVDHRTDTTRIYYITEIFVVTYLKREVSNRDQLTKLLTLLESRESHDINLESTCVGQSVLLKGTCSQIIQITRKHSSRMRSARLPLGVRGGRVSYVACPEGGGYPSPWTYPPPRHTPLKGT